MCLHEFSQQAYQGEKPFANFLSGIACEKGIPIWVFYVNRGQLNSGFGTRDKNGAMMEFFPADQAYTNVAQVGFRTFIQFDDKVIECFQECNKEHQTLVEEAHQVTIQEWIPSLQTSVELTYFTLPQEQVGGLVRKVSIKNQGQVLRKVTILDGLAKMLPSNVDSGFLKNMSNTLRS